MTKQKKIQIMLELLNQCVEEWWKPFWKKSIDVKRAEQYAWTFRWYFWDNSYQRFKSDRDLISIESWLIKRLVEHNKIDSQKFREKAKFLILSNSIKYYEFLIMELSIQKKPINFLLDVISENGRTTK